ncbi:MAG: mechanosensitive ion channel family protein, partial [Lentimicrobiaceae bacterium]|nr:mechanosensitive ion channel family protein [Lentimicrobiaceae bacterium]
LDDFYAEYQINAYIHDANKMPAIYSELNQHIQDVFREAGIELVVPHYEAHRDGSHSTIPKE